MNTYQLEFDWLTRSPVDFEYNQYRLKAYLKAVHHRFGKTQIYPDLENTQMHLNFMQQIQSSADELKKGSFSRLLGINNHDRKLIFESTLSFSNEWKEIEKTLEFSIPKLKDAVEEGREISDFLEEQLTVETVGITPLYKSEGYVFFHSGANNHLHIFRYKAVPVNQDVFGRISVSLSFLEKIRKQIGQSLNDLKTSLTRKFKDLPNPLVYHCYSEMEAPIQDTLVPITSKIIGKNLFR